jgi:hypothetical protein
VIALVLAGALWFGIGSSTSVSAGATTADCSQALTNQGLSNSESLVPTVVGSGSSVGLAVFDVDREWRWCFSGVGTGTGIVRSSTLHGSVEVPIAVLDGGFGRDVLMLIHHDRQTQTVVVDTAWSRSVVLAKGDGFEGLRVSMTKWPRWHTPWSRTPVVLGQILGFNSGGRLTSSTPFSWCPGSIDDFPGQGC